MQIHNRHKILLIDNYDSFTYNLVQYLGILGADVTVWRHDECSLEMAQAFQADGLVISPGPCSPHESGISMNLIRSMQIPTLGVCLGHQCIGQAFGARIDHAPEPVHGKTSLIEHTGKGLFEGLPHPLKVTRYHSLAVFDLPDELEVTAQVDNIIMGLQHHDRPIYGVQFHPESIGTDSGLPLLNNFLSLVGRYQDQYNRCHEVYSD